VVPEDADTDADADALMDEHRARCRKVQQDLAGLASRILTTVAFGVMMPLLLVLAPVVSWLNLRAMHWIAFHSDPVPFGEELAERILVQSPTFVLRNLAYALNAFIMILVLVDLEFGILPIILYFVAIAVLIIVMMLVRKRWECVDQQARAARAAQHLEDRLEVQIAANPMRQSPTELANFIQETRPQQPRTETDRLKLELSVKKEEMRAGIITREQYDSIRRERLEKSGLRKIFGRNETQGPDLKAQLVDAGIITCEQYDSIQREHLEKSGSRKIFGRNETQDPDLKAQLVNDMVMNRDQNRINKQTTKKQQASPTTEENVVEVNPMKQDSGSSGLEAKPANSNGETPRKRLDVISV